MTSAEGTERTGRARSANAPTWKRLVTSPIGVAALLANLVVLFLVVLGPTLWGAAAETNDIEALGAAPSSEHPFGTDALGRDILARVLVATRLSVGLALSATVLGMVIGIVIGCVAALSVSPVRRLIAGLIDILVAFPGLLLALFLAIVFGAGPQGAVLALGTAIAPAFARLTYTVASGVVGRDYVAAARTLGISRARILVRHVLPNISEPLVVNGTLTASQSLLAFASLSFLGLGVQLPAYDWGRLLGDGLNSIYSNPLAALAPGLAIVVASLAFNLAGEAAAQVLGRRVAMSARSSRKLLHGTLGWSSTVPAAADTEAVADSDAVADSEADIPEPEVAASTTDSGSDPATGPATGPATSDVVLRVQGLQVAIPLDEGTVATPVVDVSMEVRRGEAVGIVGESGSGKTMTAMAIAQLTTSPVAVRAAALEVDGVALEDLSRAARRRHLGTALAMVFQDPTSSLNPTMRTGAQLAEFSREHQGAGRRSAWARAVDRLRSVHIPSPERRAKQYPHELSGGMRQRVMIAMGLMGDPALIIADEPTTALDVTVQAQVLRMIKRAQRHQNSALVLISHDLSVISAMCDRVLVMYAGRVVEELDSRGLVEGPAHPYTRALLAALPDMKTDRDASLVTIPGRPPHPAALPPGCSFAPRCPWATQVCLSEVPTLLPSPAGGRAACHHPQRGPVTSEPPRRPASDATVGQSDTTVGQEERR